jgi:hypothetical protein
MERLLGGGFYGPGFLLSRMNDNDTMKSEDYTDILADWKEETDLYEYLCKLM